MVALEMWAEVRQSRQNIEFLIKMCPQGTNLLKRILQNVRSDDSSELTVE